MPKTLHYSINPHACPGYVMFNHFSFTDGRLNIGQSQHVAVADVAKAKEALARGGWTEAGYKYVNGRPVLTAARVG